MILAAMGMAIFAAEASKIGIMGAITSFTMAGLISALICFAAWLIVR